MNIEIANRLVNFRKQNGLSQEQLAEKIGVSRQAVSKWERSEASPDTDNLILLARLYNVSLDELLRTDDEIPTKEADEPVREESDTSGFDASGSAEGTTYYKKEGVHVGTDGIHVDDGNEHVHIDNTGIHVVNSREEVHVTKDGVFVNGECKHDFGFKFSFPYALLVIIAFVCLGIFLNAWWWCWILFLTIPVFHGTVSAIKRRKIWLFPYEICVVIAYLIMGMFCHWWHPGWIVFLTIPFYRALIRPFKKRGKGNFSWDNFCGDCSNDCNDNDE